MGFELKRRLPPFFGFCLGTLRGFGRVSSMRRSTSPGSGGGTDSAVSLPVFLSPDLSTGYPHVYPRLSIKQIKNVSLHTTTNLLGLNVQTGADSLDPRLQADGGQHGPAISLMVAGPPSYRIGGVAERFIATDLKSVGVRLLKPPDPRGFESHRLRQLPFR